MGFVGNISMLVPTLNGLPDWGPLGSIMSFLNSGIGNAAWTMVVFTILLKLVTFPLDFYSRYKMKKNAVIMEDMKPQLEKLEKQCKGDKQLYNQRMYPLLKKEGYSIGGACLPTLVTLVLFLLIWSWLNSYATYRNAYIYNELVIEYNNMTEGENATLNPDIAEDKEIIDANLVKKYNELNPSWLWVKNPWRPDVTYAEGFFNFMASANPVPTYDEFKHLNGKSNYGVAKINMGTGDTALEKIGYDKIMDPVRESKGTGNGYYILIVLAVGVSFLSQFIMQKTQKATPQPSGGMNPGTMKFMMILFPLMLGFFAFSYSSVFTLYIITNSLFSLFATIAINYIVEIKMKKLKEKKLAQITYRR